VCTAIVSATIAPIWPTTATFIRGSTAAVYPRVCFLCQTPIHGGQLILVVQQQSTEWISPTEETAAVWRNICLFHIIVCVQEAIVGATDRFVPLRRLPHVNTLLSYNAIVGLESRGFRKLVQPLWGISCEQYYRTISMNLYLYLSKQDLARQQQESSQRWQLTAAERGDP